LNQINSSIRENEAKELLKNIEKLRALTKNLKILIDQLLKKFDFIGKIFMMGKSV